MPQGSLADVARACDAEFTVGRPIMAAAAF
jgi:hypothetical protein